MNKCSQCTSQFEISLEDKILYKKFGHEPTGFCFDCDQKNRLCFRNERKLYKRKCDLSGKDIISIYSPDKPYIVYANDVWHSDDWNALDYGQDFDFNRPFFEQFAELQLKVPRTPLINLNSENSDYCNMCVGNKNCYLVFGGDFNQDVLYGTLCMYNKNCLDLDFSNKNELCYELGDAISSYGCQYTFDSKNCRNCFFISDCSNCTECILCTNLSNKSYCIENIQYSKDEYLNKQKSLITGNYKDQQKLLRKFFNLRNDRIVKFSHMINCQNCSGDYLKNSKNCHNCYDISDSEDIKDVICTIKAKDCFNASLVGHDTELVFNSVSILGGGRYKFVYYILDSTDVEYSEHILNSNNCFGCIGLNHQEYCIFNKQYSKKEYEILKNKVIEHMKSAPYPSTSSGSSQNSEWGQFFPKILSCFGYNETTAFQYYPINRDEAILQGFKWSDLPEEVPQADKIIPADRLPDNIADIPNDILNWAIKCENGGHPFKITEFELKFYRNNNIPIPHKCSECRHNVRFNLRNPKKLWNSKCDKCNVDIQTTYAPDRSEKVYCERCYLETVY